jgi:hypothetical protein
LIFLLRYSDVFDNYLSSYPFGVRDGNDTKTTCAVMQRRTVSRVNVFLETKT